MIRFIIVFLLLKEFLIQDLNFRLKFLNFLILKMS